MSATENERPQRIEHAGKLLLQSASALEDENWTKLNALLTEAAREARCLSLLDRELREGAD